MSLPPVLRFRLFEGFPHAASTRAGGVSAGRWASLNLSGGSGDAPDRVAENRRRFAAAAGVDPAAVTSMHQVHGATVRVVGPEERGAGYVSERPPLPDADALVTRTPGVALIAKSADCPVVLLADPKAGVVGVAHAGWRGTLAGVVPAALKAMAELGADPVRIVAGIAPCAGPCCYQVKGDVAAKFLAEWPHAYRFLVPKGEYHRHLDLRAALRAQLAAAGVGEDRVEAIEACTICDAGRFFSYRRDGPGCGHQGAILGLSV